MELKSQTSKKNILLFALLIHLLASNFVQGQSWSIEYVLNGDSSVYTLSQDKILQGKPVDFFFPAYKYNQTSSKEAVESVSVSNKEVIELELDTRLFNFENIHFEIDLYAEEMDTLQFFLKTTDDRLIPMIQRTHRNGYTYLPTVTFSANIINKGIQSIQIVGKSKNENKKFIVGRINGSKKIAFTAENMIAVDSLVSKYAFEQQSETFVELPDHYLRLHGFNMWSRLVLKDCRSTADSIQSICQYTNTLLNDYELYDLYGINRQELINRNVLFAQSSKDIDSYYKGLKEIIASLNSCHMRLTTSQQDDVESPLQAIYFYNINNKISVSAIFDPTLENKIQLGDQLLSINSIPLEELYHDFFKHVFASSPQQREIKVTQKLLYMAKEAFGDSLLLEFQNNDKNYFVWLNNSNFVGKKVVPSDFKIVSDNLIEKYNKTVYIKPVFLESSLIPYLYSHKNDFNNCEGLVIDLRGCSAADYSFCTFFSYLIANNSLILTTGTGLLTTCSDYTVQFSKIINIQAPVVVLIDSRTACASELMVNALRKVRSNIYVLGATNSAGSAQLAMRIDLPLNGGLAYFEGVTKDAFGKAIDDNTGIMPDSAVIFDSYKDLFPYNDRIKILALEYLGNSRNYIKENIQY